LVARGNLDRHGVHFLAAYVAGGRDPDTHSVVPHWYHTDMAMNLRLSDAESEALRAKADEEGRSMQEVARTAIAQYVSERPQRLRSAIERVRDEDRELLERLAQ
jgi:predicted transcriptional regulator